MSGAEYRRARAQSAWAITALNHVLPPHKIGARDWRELAAQVNTSPKEFLSSIGDKTFPQVVTWTLLDRRRVTPVPPGHWLLLHDAAPFRATLRLENSSRQQHASSIEVLDGHVAVFAPQKLNATVDARLEIERYAPANQNVVAAIRFLAGGASFLPPLATPAADSVVLLTNGIGGMARMGVDLGQIHSKYDCALAANRNDDFPTDRHVFVKRVRVWLNADGFITPLNAHNLVSIEPGPPAIWKFSAKVGDQRIVEIELTADMLDGKNTTVLRFENRSHPIESARKSSEPTMNVSLTVRVDIEDRNFHSETHRNPGAEHHFSGNSRPLDEKAGFSFTPAPDRHLRVYSDTGFYHHEAEWSENIPHPVEQSRGQVGAGDAFSPGWFELPLARNKSASVVLCADVVDPSSELVNEIASSRLVENKLAHNRAKFSKDDSFGRQLVLAARQFVVKRGSGKTVIAGYPWFLDWGRDSLIAARGLLAAGLVSDVTELLITFGRFVENGTMPNTIHGGDASNRDTSDAPLWFGVVCEEAARLLSENLYELIVDKRGRSIADVLREIAVGYLRGTPNGIRMDAASGLVWSPSNGYGHELPRNQVASRSEATSKEDLRGQLHALVGQPLGVTR